MSEGTRSTLGVLAALVVALVVANASGLKDWAAIGLGAAFGVVAWVLVWVLTKPRRKAD